MSGPGYIHGGLEYIDRAKRLIDEQNPLDDSPLTTASRDLRAARAAVAKLVEEAEQLLDYAQHGDRSGKGRNISAVKADLRAALARVKGGAA